MRMTWFRGWTCAAVCTFLVVAQSGCNLSQMRYRMNQAWRGGIVGEDIGAADSNDPWANAASQEMANHHPPSYTDPSDRYFSSDQARAISAGLDGHR